jgi:uncharacterized protein
VVKGVNYLSEHIYVAKTEGNGRGVFTKSALKKNTVIEIAPVIVMSGTERKLLDKTLLHDYIFEWGEKGQQCCMALGYVPLYNHSYQSNCEYEMHFRQQVIKIKTVRDISAGEELFINYNGDWDNEKKVWFEAGPT